MVAKRGKQKLLEPRSIRLEPDVKAALEAVAEAEDRSLSYIINRILREWVASSRIAEDQKGQRAK
jgi:predicted transcriptional regulator